jgi:hypothetical protein
MPACFGQRPFVVAAHRYYQQLICSQFCEGNRPDRSVVIHAAMKKKFSKSEIQIIFLWCEKLSQ